MATGPIKRQGKKGTAWRVRWRYGGTRDGAWQSVTLPNRADAVSLKRRVEERGHMVRSDDDEVRDRSLITGRAPRRPQEAVTWAEAGQAWLAERTGITAGTERKYRRLLAEALSVWDDLPVAEVGRSEAAALVKAHRLVKGDYLLVVARAVLSYAAREGWRGARDDPFAGVRLYPPRPDLPMFLTDEEVKLLLAAVDRSKASREWPVQVRLALGTGVRIGELCALQRGDLRTDARPMLTIARSVGPDGVGPTKGRRARTLVLDPNDAAMLVEHGRGLRRDAWLFPRLDDPAEPMQPDTVRDRWKRARRAAARDGLERSPRFHDLRHTHASQLIERGVPMLAVSRRLGHESTAITDRTYGHLGQRSDDTILAALAAR